MFSDDAAQMRNRHDDQVDALSLAYNTLPRRNAAAGAPAGAEGDTDGQA